MVLFAKTKWCKSIKSFRCKKQLLALSNDHLWPWASSVLMSSDGFPRIAPPRTHHQYCPQVAMVYLIDFFDHHRMYSGDLTWGQYSCSSCTYFIKIVWHFSIYFKSWGVEKAIELFEEIKPLCAFDPGSSLITPLLNGLFLFWLLGALFTPGE